MKSQQFVDIIMNTPLVSDEKVISIAIQGIIDYLASSLQARHQPELIKFKHWIQQEGGAGRSWLIGQSQLVTARQSALFNGFQAHLLDYDDVHALVRGHPSAVILSALFASIDLTLHEKALDSRRFLTAYIIGVEVMARLGEILNPKHYLKGWHSTATLGGISAVCAIAYLHEYPFLTSALALTATQSSGLRLLFGTPIKALHSGMAAQAAIQSIEWLNNGLTAEKDIFHEELGFLSVFDEKAIMPDLTNWGKHWQIQELWFKTYPYCSAAAGVADATLKLKAQLKDLQQIEHIEVIFHPKTDIALCYNMPQIRSEGRFSAEYIIANILHNIELDFQHFDIEKISPEIQELMTKISRTYQPNPSNTRKIKIKVQLKNQKLLREYSAYPKGSPQNPYSQAELQQKLFMALNNHKITTELSVNIQLLKQGINMSTFITSIMRLI